MFEFEERAHSTQQRQQDASKDICDKLTDMNVRLSPNCDSLLYTELYTITADVKAHVQNILHDLRQDVEDYKVQPIMQISYEAYHLCVHGADELYINNRSPIILRYKLNMFPDTFVSHKIKKALLYSANPSAKNALKLMRDTSDIRAQSSTTAFNMLDTYIQKVQYVTQCDKGKHCEKHARQEALKQVYVALGYDCYSYCAHAHVNFESTPKPRRVFVGDSRNALDIGCFGLSQIKYFPGISTQSIPRIREINNNTYRTNYYISNISRLPYTLCTTTFLFSLCVMSQLARQMGRALAELVNAILIILRGMQRIENEEDQ